MKRILQFATRFWISFKTAMKTFISENYIRYSASLSYYTIFSLAPLLIITIMLCGYVLSRQGMEGKIYAEIGALVGDSVAKQIEQMVWHIASAQGSSTARITGIIAIVLGIIGVYTEVQDSMNRIWDLKTKPGLNWKRYLTKRVISFGVFSITGVILVLSIMLNSVIAVFSTYITSISPRSGIYVAFAFSRITIVVISTTFFAFIFKYLPDGKVKFTDALWGALFTSIFFMLGKLAIGSYLIYSRVASLYGAAGSLVAILLWIYYSSVIIFFGAAFTKAYAYHFGGRIVPNSYSVCLEMKEI